MAFEYVDNEGLPYALEMDRGSSFFMRGKSKADWAELDSLTAAKFEINGSPISEEKALAMARELSVPEPEQISHETIDKTEEQGPSTPAKEEGQSELSNLEKAISLAVEGHRGQKDKAGASYILHPLRVMFKMDSEEKMIAAVLHDLLEDTDTSLEDLKAHGFGPEILEAIDSVTRRDDEEYEEFIDRAGLHPAGADIKMADIEDNMDLSRIAHIGDRDLKRIGKYHRAMKRLKKLKDIRRKLMCPND